LYLNLEEARHPILKFSTRAIHAGQEPDPTTGAIVTPIYQTSTFIQEKADEIRAYKYTRLANPTRTALEECLASLENAQHGLAFASGMAACATALKLLSVGDHVIVGDDVYGGVYTLFDQIVSNQGISCTFVDACNLDEVEKALRTETKMIWIETPTNPLLKIADIKALTTFAKQHNLLSVLDNTFATPYLQKPLEFGIDLVIHSTTKYLAGHSDVVGGAVLTNRDDLHEKLAFIQSIVGSTPSPFDCWLTLRGIKTLALRMREHEHNAGKVAQFLAGSSAIERVFYPGLPSHPQHELAKRQMSGFGGMVSCVVKDGLKGAKSFAESTKLFALAVSLGGVESLICHPANMTHNTIPKEVRDKRGISDGLLRLSVGIEDADDLIADLKQALKI
jgi:cystathionine gamma-lyase